MPKLTPIQALKLTTDNNRSLIVIRPIATIVFCTLIAAGCGGSSNDSNPGTGTGTNTGNGGTGTGTGTGGTSTPIPAGPAPSFGDTATQANGLPATTKVCPTSVTESYTGWALSGETWCAYKCPAGDENADGDDWGFFTSNQNSCRDTSAAPGSTITATIFTPDSERIYVSANANPASASPYSCASWRYNETSRVWENEGSQFSLSLFSNNTGTDAGTPTTWSFANGVLTLESGRTLTNVAVGNGSFSSWKSNTALIRCSS